MIGTFCGSLSEDAFIHAGLKYVASTQESLETPRANMLDCL